MEVNAVRTAMSNNPTATKVGIGAVVVAVGGGIVWGVKHFIGKPLAAGTKSFRDSFKETYAAEKAAEAAASEDKEEKGDK